MQKNLHLPQIAAVHGCSVPGKIPFARLQMGLSVPLLALCLLVTPASAADIEVYELPESLTASYPDPAQAALAELPPPFYATEKEVFDVWMATVRRPYAYAYAGTMPPDPANRPLLISTPKPAPRKTQSTKPSTKAAPSVTAPVQTPNADSANGANSLNSTDNKVNSQPNNQASTGTNASGQGKSNPLAPSNFTPAPLPLPGVPSPPQNNSRPTSLLDSVPQMPNAVPTPGGPYSGPAPSVPVNTPS